MLERLVHLPHLGLRQDWKQRDDRINDIITKHNERVMPLMQQLEAEVAAVPEPDGISFPTPEGDLHIRDCERCCLTGWPILPGDDWMRRHDGRMYLTAALAIPDAMIPPPESLPRPITDPAKLSRRATPARKR